MNGRCGQCNEPIKGEGWTTPDIPVQLWFCSERCRNEAKAEYNTIFVVTLEDDNG